jgi:hypothetical protein
MTRISYYILLILDYVYIVFSVKLYVVNYASMNIYVILIRKVL